MEGELQEAKARFQTYIDSNANQTGQVTFQNVKELLENNVQFYVTVKSWFSGAYEARVTLVFDDIKSQFFWKYHDAMAIWSKVETKKHSSHFYINNEVIYYLP
jgi:hypothetical protein